MWTKTGRKENRGNFWTWKFRADLYVLFKIDKSRASKVLVEVLGKEFNGVLGSDYFSAYNKLRAGTRSLQYGQAFSAKRQGLLRVHYHLRVDPTDNLAEQAVRFVVIDRRITQGTRIKKGRETNERLWTVVGPCSLQGRSTFDFILAAVRAHFRGDPVPSLLSALG